ncbi:hypothetical protein PFISCL1PPCAC_28897, partial [Pristionchus fissidentatus]
LRSGWIHWTIAETTGPGPRDYESASCSIVDGDTVRYATVTCDYWRDNYEEEIWYLCELDLATMEWTRRMIIMDEEVFAVFRRWFHRYRCVCKWRKTTPALYRLVDRLWMPLYSRSLNDDL